MDVDYNSFIRSIKSDIDVARKEESVTNSSANRAELTIKDFEKIINNFEFLSSIKSNDERARKINDITKAGLEDAPSIIVLKGRIDLFVKTYQKAKDLDKLPEFFSCFAKGDPCLSGRMESLSKFATNLELGIDIDSQVDPEKMLFFPAYILSEIIDNAIDEEGSGITPDSITKEKLNEYLLKNIDSVAEEFELAPDSEYKINFLAYLKDRGLESTNENGLPDWKRMILNLLNAKESFQEVYKFTRATSVD